MKSQEALKLLPGLGKSLPVISQTKKDKEKFTIKYVYKKFFKIEGTSRQEIL